MIEMRWVKLATDYPMFEANIPRFEYATNLGGFACVLQFRESKTAPVGSSIDGGTQYNAQAFTDWKDVEVAGEEA